MGMATSGSCSVCGENNIDLTGKTKHSCTPKCPICGRLVSTFPSATCAAQHGKCGICGDWRTRCKCMTSSTMAAPDPLKQGVKFDDGKPDWSLLPSDAVVDIIRVYEYGCKKYERNNWRKGLLFSRIFSAIMRHLWAWWGQEDKDKESGLKHLAQAAWGCLTLLEYMRVRHEYRSFDDRTHVSESEEKAEKLFGAWKSGGKEEETELDQMVCAHEWRWKSQYSDSAGVHITKECARCNAQTQENLLPVPPSTTISIPSVWVPLPGGQIVEATVTSTTSGGADDQKYVYSNGELKALSKHPCKIGLLVKIRHGAKYRQDFGSHIWQGDDTVFTIESQGSDGMKDSWWLSAPGYGDTPYGNGGVLVRECDLIDVSGGE